MGTVTTSALFKIILPIPGADWQHRIIIVDKDPPQDPTIINNFGAIEARILAVQVGWTSRGAFINLSADAVNSQTGAISHFGIIGHDFNGNGTAYANAITQIISAFPHDTYLDGLLFTPTTPISPPPTTPDKIFGIPTNWLLLGIVGIIGGAIALLNLRETHKTRKATERREQRESEKETPEGEFQQKFIQGAVKKPGSLRRTVQERFGKEGFTERGTIKESAIEELAQEKGKTGKRARLAKTLRSFR